VGEDGLDGEGVLDGGDNAQPAASETIDYARQGQLEAAASTDIPRPRRGGERRMWGLLL